MLNELRLERACNLLITSRLPIAVVSELCRFSNVPYFNRRFLEKKAANQDSLGLRTLTNYLYGRTRVLTRFSHQAL